MLLSGQAASSVAGPAASSAKAESRYPEQAYLSPTRYTNEFFGFALDLPADAHLLPIPEPVASDGRIQLLQLGGPAPDDASVSIAALPPAGRGALDAKVVLRRALDQELFRGVEELRGLSKTTLAGHQFYFYETRRGIDQHMLAGANLDGYVVLMQLGAHNENMMKDLESSLQHIVFFAPAQVRQYLTADAQAYEGPAISSHRLAQLEADPPENHIDPGKLEGGIYRNPVLGFSYQVPPGWVVEAEGAVLPAIERARASDSLDGLLGGGPDAGAAERQLLKACSRTLFSVWAKRPGPDGQIPYDDFGEVTLSAISAECFPGVKFPASSTDAQAARDFLLLIGLTHPILRDMRDAKAFTSQGTVFLLLHGNVGFKVPNDELSRRLSIAMAITQRQGYLLTWFFAAPHDSELQQLLAERVSFDPVPTTKDADATRAGGGGAAAGAGGQGTATSTNSVAGSSSRAAGSSGSVTSANLPGGGSTVDSNPSTAAAGQNGAPSPPASDTSSQPQNDSSSTPQSTRPTLLRPGETIQSQQGSGAPVKKH
ncbi:MAG: hypothetical protein WBM04_05770 [Candidatus Korobacteraceae bacterium]